MIEKRISNRSTNEEEFKKASTDYNKALKESGYKKEIIYQPESTKNKKKNRSRNIIWFNPPYCKSVKTPIARKFLRLINKHFHKEHPLHKIFNKNSINLSYSCMPNMAQIINNHNQKILRNKNKLETENCKHRNLECPLKESGESCKQKDVIYEAEVRTENNLRTYIGLTSLEFRQRWYAHRQLFNNKNRKDDTELSKYIWTLKENKTKFDLKWKLLKKVKSIENGGKICRLCLTEAELIINNKNGPLNTRLEIMNKCRHRAKFLLKNWKSEKQKKTNINRN